MQPNPRLKIVYIMLATITKTTATAATIKPLAIFSKIMLGFISHFIYVAKLKIDGGGNVDWAVE